MEAVCWGANCQPFPQSIIHCWEYSTSLQCLVFEIFSTECSVNHYDIALICTLYLWYVPTLWSYIFVWMIMIIFYFKFMSKVISYIWFCPLNWPTQTTLSQKYLQAGEIFLPNRLENKQRVGRPERPGAGDESSVAAQEYFNVLFNPEKYLCCKN